MFQTRLPVPSRCTDGQAGACAPFHKAPRCSTRHAPLPLGAQLLAATGPVQSPCKKHSAYSAGQHTSRRCKLVCRVAAPDAAAPSADIPRISDLDTFPIIDNQGLVNPLAPAGTQAHVFAILDDKKKLQYIGFSKELRGTLRTLLGRRPEKAHFFKAVHFPDVDQAAMVATREAWYEECGGAPPGNKLALERNMWQKPVDGGAISARGKRGAAEDKAREHLAMIRSRGCTEPFTPAPELLDDGVVDFLPVASLTEEQLAAAREAAAKAAKESRSCSVLIDGQPKHFTVRFLSRTPTNGGHLFDLVLSYDNQESKHRVVVGKEYYEPSGLEPELPVEAALGLVLQKKLPRTRQPGAMLSSSQFPAAYFAVGGVEQWFGDEFLAVMDDMSGKRLRAEGAAEPDYWRFNRTEDYGPMRQENPANLTAALGLINPIA